MADRGDLIDPVIVPHVGGAGVALGPDCADPFGPKAVRASMGAVFAVPLARCDGDPAGLPGITVALVPGAGRPLAELEPELRAGELTIMIGAERAGLPDELAARADRTVEIPIATHSLNAAMAATVALYEVNRITDLT